MNIFDAIKSLSKGIAVLIDPDKFKSKDALEDFLKKIKIPPTSGTPGFS